MLKENEGQEQNCVGLTVQREARCTNDLLCCPFCGSNQPQKQKATTTDGEFHSWKIWCKQCNCRTGPEKSLSKAIKTWNLRAE